MVHACFITTLNQQYSFKCKIVQSSERRIQQSPTLPISGLHATHKSSSITHAEALKPEF
jgi:hypothetical protein